MKDEGGSRGDVEVAGTGGKTAGGEGIRKKKRRGKSPDRLLHKAP